MPDRFEVLTLGRITPSPTNPRKLFDQTKLEELAASIKAQGLIQPIVVRQLTEGGELAWSSEGAALYELVAGERRYRASKIAGSETINAIIRELTDDQVLEIQIIENAQRDDVHPLEECDGFRRILDSGIYGEGAAAIEKLAEKIGKSPRLVYDRLKLRDLSEATRELWLKGDLGLTYSHAVELSRLDPKRQAAVIKESTNWKGQLESVRVMAEKARKTLTPLRQAPFPLSSEYAGKIACDQCPKGTLANPFLFPDLDQSKGPMCSDAKCYEHKRSGFEECRIADAKAQHGGDIVKLSVGWCRSKKDVLSHSEWQAKENGARVGIVVEVGEYYSGNLKPYDIVRFAGVSKQSDNERYQAEQKERDRQSQIRENYRERLWKVIDKADGPLPQGAHYALWLLLILADEWEARKFLVAELGCGGDLDSIRLAIRQLSSAELPRLAMLAAARFTRYAMADEVAVALGIDTATLKARSEAAFPPPGTTSQASAKKKRSAIEEAIADVDAEIAEEEALEDVPA